MIERRGGSGRKGEGRREEGEGEEMAGRVREGGREGRGVERGCGRTGGRGEAL